MGAAIEAVVGEQGEAVDEAAARDGQLALAVEALGQHPAGGRKLISMQTRPVSQSPFACMVLTG